MNKDDWALVSTSHVDDMHCNLRNEMAHLIAEGYSQADAMQWMLSWARRNASGYSAPFANYILGQNREDYGC